MWKYWSQGLWCWKTVQLWSLIVNSEQSLKDIDLSLVEWDVNSVNDCFRATVQTCMKVQCARRWAQYQQIPTGRRTQWSSAWFSSYRNAELLCILGLLNRLYWRSSLPVVEYLGFCMLSSTRSSGVSCLSHLVVTSPCIHREEQTTTHINSSMHGVTMQPASSSIFTTISLEDAILHARTEGGLMTAPPGMSCLRGVAPAVNLTLKAKRLLSWNRLKPDLEFYRCSLSWLKLYLVWWGKGKWSNSCLFVTFFSQ